MSDEKTGTIEMCETPQIDTAEDLVSILGAAVKVGCLTGATEFIDHQGGVPARATHQNRREVRVVLHNGVILVISLYAIAPPVTHHIAPPRAIPPVTPCVRSTKAPEASETAPARRRRKTTG